MSKALAKRSIRRRRRLAMWAAARFNHCIEQKVGIVELWTADDGPGRFLCEKFGFCKVEIAGKELDSKPDDNDQIRMRLALTDLSTVGH